MWHPVTSPSAPAELLADGGGAFSGAASDAGARSPSRGGSPIKPDWFLNVAAALKTPLEQCLLALIHSALAAVLLLLGGAARGSAAWPAGG